MSQEAGHSMITGEGPQLMTKALRGQSDDLAMRARGSSCGDMPTFNIDDDDDSKTNGTFEDLMKQFQTFSAPANPPLPAIADDAK